jgi:hypothetical protein
MIKEEESHTIGKKMRKERIRKKRGHEQRGKRISPIE